MGLRELLPWAKAIARVCLDPKYCVRWAKERDFLIYEAVALTLDNPPDEDQRDGAHCLLLTMSGKKLIADALMWRSWIAAHMAVPGADAPRLPVHDIPCPAPGRGVEASVLTPPD